MTPEGPFELEGSSQPTSTVSPYGMLIGIYAFLALCIVACAELLVLSLAGLVYGVFLHRPMDWLLTCTFAVIAAASFFGVRSALRAYLEQRARKPDTHRPARAVPFLLLLGGLGAAFALYLFTCL